MAETQPLCPPPGRTNVAYFNDHMKSLTWPDKRAWVKSEEEFDKKQTREVLAEYRSRIAKAENVKYVPQRPLTSAPDHTRRAFGCLPLAGPWNPSEKGFYTKLVVNKRNG
eukprot:COSAG05_NODE_1597_length_4454_cov_228.028932_5_plen_110_part_00